MNAKFSIDEQLKQRVLNLISTGIFPTTTFMNVAQIIQELSNLKEIKQSDNKNLKVK